VQLGNNIFRIFCFFDDNNFVLLLTDFQKKIQKTPPDEIKRTVRLMEEYHKENDGENISLKTLFDIVERGLRGRFRIEVQL